MTDKLVVRAVVVYPAPSTFYPVTGLQVPSDPLHHGPGDEYRVRIWGQWGRHSPVIVDRGQHNYVAESRQISVAGRPYGELATVHETRHFKGYSGTLNITARLSGFVHK